MHDDFDLVRVIIDRLVSALPEVPVETVWRVEQSIRHEYGGQRVYIRATAGVEHRREAIKRAMANGVRVADLCESTGISRSTIYNILKTRNCDGDHS